MKLTQKQVIEEIKMGKSLKDFPKWKDNKEVVLAAIKMDGRCLHYVSERLRDDKEIILEGIKKYGRNLEYASKRLRDDKEIVLKAVTDTGWALEYASKRLRDDKGMVLEAIRNNYWALEYASQRLKDDKEVVLEAVKQYGWVLEYASDRLKEELLLQTVRSFGYKGGIEPIELVKHSGNFLSLLTTEKQNNKEIVLEAVKKSKNCLQMASQEIRGRVGNNNPVRYLEQWIKSEEQKNFLNQKLDKKENKGKIKL